MSSDGKNPRDRGRRLRAQSAKKGAELWKHLTAKCFGGFKFRPTPHWLLRRRSMLCQMAPDFELDDGQHADDVPEAIYARWRIRNRAP